MLVVENDAATARELSTQLVRMGCGVIGLAHSVAAALALTETGMPDIVLLDAMVKADSDDIEVWRVLQERFDVAVIHLAAYGDDGARAQSTNPYGYVLKPVRQEELRRAIELALRKRKLVADLATELASGSGQSPALSKKAQPVTAVPVPLGASETTFELQQALRAKDIFLTRISHELRTPLASILGFSDTLSMGLHGSLNEEQSRHLTTIQRNGEHLLSLVNDLLDLSRLTAEPTELQMDLVRCAEVIKEVAATAAPLASNKRLLLTTHIQEPELAVRVNRRALHQILLNLVGNAVKFTESGSVSLGCRRRAGANGWQVLYEVRDTGPGLCKEDREKLFRPFCQLQDSVDARFRGSGLGLHLSMKLAEQMNGTIRVGGAPGIGSVFTLVLPTTASSD